MNKLFLLVFLSSYLLANPSWLYNIKSTSQNEIIGYGISDKLSNAKQNAIADIVKTISVEVDTSTDISKSIKNGNYQKDILSNLTTKSKAILSGVKVLKVVQENGFWYVASSYDNSPLELKLKKKLPNNIQSQLQNEYLKNTELFKVFNKEISVNLNYDLIRKDNLWQIKYKDIVIPLTQNDFYKLFSNQSNKSILLKANKKIYQKNDEIYFDITLPQKGYISILYVEHNGKVGVLLSNKLKNKNFTYPDLKSEDTFKVANPYGTTIKELYIALYSKEMIDLSKFENVSENLLDESNYNFHELIKKFPETKFSTFTVKIRK